MDHDGEDEQEALLGGNGGGANSGLYNPDLIQNGAHNNSDSGSQAGRLTRSIVYAGQVFYSFFLM